MNGHHTDRVSGDRRFSRKALISLCAIAIAGMVLVIMASRWGAVVERDSVSYISAAENIAAGKGVMLSRQPGEFIPMTHWPPGYPAVLAVGILSGLTPQITARIIGVLLLGATVLLTAFVIRRHSESDQPAVIGGLFSSISFGMISLHATVNSEPLFIFLCTCVLAMLARWLDKPSPAMLTAAALAASAAMLVRYAGAAVIAAGVLAILLARHMTVRERLSRAFLFGLVASIPVLAWMVRNAIVGGPFVGRTLEFEPIGIYHIRSFASGLSLWLFPPELDRFVRVPVGLAIIMVAVAGLAWLYRRHGPVNSSALVASACFITCYWALFAITVVAFDHGVSLSIRTQTPVFVATVILVAILIDRSVRPAKQRRAIALAAIAILALATITTGIYVARGYRDGFGYTSRQWRQSDLIAAIRRLPPDHTVFTNDVRGVQFLTSRPAVDAEFDYNRNTRRMDAARLNYLKTVVARMKQRDHRLYYFARSENEDDIFRELGLVPMESYPDGRIYRAE